MSCVAGWSRAVSAGSNRPVMLFTFDGAVVLAGFVRL